MMLLVFTGLALPLVPLFGGRLRRLAEVRFRLVWLLLLALAIQVGLFVFALGEGSGLQRSAYVATYCLGIGFLLANRRIPGMWLIGLGTVLNVTAIIANGGIMPAAEHALAAAGLPADLDRFTNSFVMDSPRLAFLGDIFAVPASWPFANVFSAGDVCIVVGVWVSIHRLTGSGLVPSGSREFLTLVSHHRFMRLWAAQGVSNLGDWVYSLAVAVALADRFGGAQLGRTLAFMLIAQVAPSAVLGALFAGPLVDRHNRRTLMVLADVARAGAIASLLLSEAPSRWHFYVVALCLGLFGAVFQPSLMASIPNVVDRGQIVAANAMVAATYHVAVMAGPALGAFLMDALGPRTVFSLNAGSFAVSAILVSGVRMPRPRTTGERTSTVLRDLVEGARYIRRTPLARGVLLITGLVMLAAATKAPLEPLFVRDVLTAGESIRQTAQVLALVTMAWGMGMLLGSVAAPALARRWNRERLLPLSIGVVGLMVLAVSRTGDFSTVLLAWLVAGTANSVGNVSYESLLQERTPDMLRGRVFAATEAVLDASYLAGAGLAVLLASTLRVTAAFAVSGGLLLLAAATALRVLPQPIGRPPRPAARAARVTSEEAPEAPSRP